jgi:hypothetical protein
MRLTDSRSVNAEGGDVVDGVVAGAVGERAPVERTMSRIEARSGLSVPFPCRCSRKRRRCGFWISPCFMPTLNSVGVRV